MGGERWGGWWRWVYYNTYIYREPSKAKATNPNAPAEGAGAAADDAVGGLDRGGALDGARRAELGGALLLIRVVVRKMCSARSVKWIVVHPSNTPTYLLGLLRRLEERGLRLPVRLLVLAAERGPAGVGAVGGAVGSRGRGVVRGEQARGAAELFSVNA